MTEIEETLYQTKSKSGQDPLNFPIRLNNRLSALVSVVSSSDGAPTEQAVEVHDLVVAEIDTNLAALAEILDGDVAEFNKEISSAKIPFIFVEEAYARLNVINLLAHSRSNDPELLPR